MEFTVSKADLVRELSLSQGVVKNGTSVLALLNAPATVSRRFVRSGKYILVREEPGQFRVCPWTARAGIGDTIGTYRFSAPKYRVASLRRANYSMVRSAEMLENPASPVLPSRI